MIENENQQWIEANNYDLDDVQFELFEELVTNIRARPVRSGYDMWLNRARVMAIHAFEDTI